MTIFVSIWAIGIFITLFTLIISLVEDISSDMGIFEIFLQLGIILILGVGYLVDSFGICYLLAYP